MRRVSLPCVAARVPAALRVSPGCAVPCTGVARRVSLPCVAARVPAALRVSPGCAVPWLAALLRASPPLVPSLVTADLVLAETASLRLVPGVRAAPVRVLRVTGVLA